MTNPNLNSLVSTSKETAPSDPHEEVDVVIIGAGFSGTMVAVHLARVFPAISILLVDRDTAFARGVAYSTVFPEHLLNVSVGKISAFPEDPDHFLRWLQRHPADLQEVGIREVTRESFVSRLLYGEYLHDIFSDIAAANRGVRIALDEAVDIELPNKDKGNHDVRVRTKKGKVFSGSRVVLALGNFSPAPPNLLDGKGNHGNRILKTPWAAETLWRMRGGGDILILGAGLTALDLLLALNANGVRGHIRLLSRRGVLPEAHRSIEQKPDWFNGTPFPPSIRKLVRLFRKEIRKAQMVGVDWRAVIDAFRTHTQSVWQSFSVVERARFLRHVRPYWEAVRHRSAPVAYDVIQRMRESGQVAFQRGRILKLEETENSVKVTATRRGATTPEEWEVGFVVNCTGPETDYSRLGLPLISNLLASGLAQLSPLNMGLETASDGALIDASGAKSEYLYAVGTLRKGSLFESIAVPELRVQARDLGEKLGAEMLARVGSLSTRLEYSI
jgi:uncharacterized NAD(P)/FAD-binding protein YdhS